jgi:hypothetical protein
LVKSLLQTLFSFVLEPVNFQIGFCDTLTQAHS